MNRSKLIELIQFTAGEIITPTLSIEDAESILDEFEKQCNMTTANNCVKQ